LTVGAWVKPDDGQPVINVYFFSHYAATGDQRSISIRINPTGSIAFIMSNDGIYNTQLETTDNPVFTNGIQTDFKFLSVVYDTSTVKIYIDGVLQASTTGVGGIPASLHDSYYPFVIGATSTFSVLFDGSIQSPFIYSRALSAGEVAAFYNATRRMYGMFVVNDDGRSMKYWKDGMPFVFIGTNDSGSMKYWSGGVPAVVIS